MQNAFIESSNGRRRNELLNEVLFGTLDDMRRGLALWRFDYSHVGPYPSLSNIFQVTRVRRLSEPQAPRPCPNQ